MKTIRANTIVRAGAMIAVVGLLAACGTTAQEEARFQALEDKINQALQNSAAAKIDATTALAIAVETQDQELEAKINQALRDSTTAKIDASTALHMLTQEGQ